MSDSENKQEDAPIRDKAYCLESVQNVGAVLDEIESAQDEIRSVQTLGAPLCKDLADIWCGEGKYPEWRFTSPLDRALTELDSVRLMLFDIREEMLRHGGFAPSELIDDDQDDPVRGHELESGS